MSIKLAMQVVNQSNNENKKYCNDYQRLVKYFVEEFFLRENGVSYKMFFMNLKASIFFSPKYMPAPYVLPQIVPQKGTISLYSLDQIMFMIPILVQFLVLAEDAQCSMA